MTGLRRLLRPLRDLRDVWRAFGAAGVTQRLNHVAKLQSGRYESLQHRRLRSPPGELPQLELATVRTFFRQYPETQSRVEAEANRIVAGEYPCFGGAWWQTGWPPNWHRNPRTGEELPANRHWSRHSRNQRPRDDIKWVWEPSRFGFVYVFARAYAATGADVWPQAFWQGVEDWLDANPPFLGPNWISAQETALRLFAVEFGLFVFGRHPSSSPVRRRRAEQLLYDGGRRIASSLSYALSQRNNHALSELVALCGLALLFPEWPESPDWYERAFGGLTDCIADQFATDGAYIQESTNYHRVALHVLLWLHFIGSLTGHELPAGVDAALERSLYFLAGLQCPTSGRLPNYGANDGALVLPLSVSDFPDFRPLTQHLSSVVRGRPALPPGPWDEEMLWLAPPHDLKPLPLREVPLRVTSSGYLSSRQPRSLVFARSRPAVSHRPSQADTLHVDLWIDGRNQALDPGTYSYNDAPPWNNGLAETRFHNTCSVDDVSQMRRLSRFMWTHWTESRVLAVGRTGHRHVLLLRGWADFERSCGHWRLIVHEPGLLCVHDAVECNRTRRIRIHWNLLGTDWRTIDQSTWRAEAGVTLKVATPAGAALEHWLGDPASPLGWVSRTYGDKRPCTALEYSIEARRAHFGSTFLWESRSLSRVLERAAWIWRRGSYQLSAETLLAESG